MDFFLRIQSSYSLKSSTAEPQPLRRLITPLLGVFDQTFFEKVCEQAFFEKVCEQALIVYYTRERITSKSVKQFKKVLEPKKYSQ